MLQGRYETVAVINGNTKQAIALAVAAFQRKHAGAAPRYAWCPVGKAPSQETVTGWAQRGVIVSSSAFALGCVMAGPSEVSP